MRLSEIADEFEHQSVPPHEETDFLFRREKALMAQFASYAKKLEDKYNLRVGQLASNSFDLLTHPDEFFDDLIGDLRKYHVQAAILDSMQPHEIEQLQTKWSRALRAKRDYYRAQYADRD